VDAINWHTCFFLLFALVACAFAVAVVLSSNIVRMAFYLIVSLGATAGLFFLAGADFVGSMQLLIYVGGTLVLLVFGVMLTAQGPFVSMKTSGGDWILACLLSGCLLAILVPAGFSISSWQNRPAAALAPPAGHASSRAVPAQLVSAIEPRAIEPRAAATHDSFGAENGAELKGAEGIGAEEIVQQDSAARIGMGLLGVRVDKLESPPAQLAGGMSGYLLPFEIVSVHLLVVLIGAAYLARSKKRTNPAH
jgi:NADH:ubiquinone oxidoreductase subunit 6 (subunit J)